MSSVYSMTGYATSQGAVPASGESFTLTLKSVNHRHFDLSLRLPFGLEALEAGLRRIVKQQVKRGHIDLTLSFDHKPDSRPAAQVMLDEPTLAAYVAAFRHASHLHHLSAQLDLHELLRLPGVISLSAEAAPTRRDPADVEAAVTPVLEALLVSFQEVRSTEGDALATELRASLGRVSTLVDEAASLREDIARQQMERLRTRMTELLNGSSVSEDRIASEAAILADRGDVEEELVRLRTHVARFHSLLDQGGETGKPLDFLLQELNREANTLLSKTSGISGLRISEIGLQLKLEFERAREQVQNLE